MKAIRKVVDDFSAVLLRFLGSSKFLYVVIGVFILQAIWFAFSLSYPLAYDEAHHFGIIKAYTGQIGPIIFDQPKTLDYLSDIENQSVMYHYLMSFPLRFIMLFTDNFAAQVVALRVINILLAASALLVFAKLFKLINLPRLPSNLGLFFFSVIPVFVYLSATINYDNLLFLTAAGYFVACVNYLHGKPWVWQNIASVVSLGTFASLVKFTFLPVFAVSLVVFAIRLWPVRRTLVKNFMHSIRHLSWQRNTLIALALLATVSLFSATYLKNVITYGTPQPSCQETLGVERCKANPIVARSQIIKESKDDRKPELLSIYATTWVSNMLKDQSWVIVRAPAESNPRPDSLPVIQNTLYFGGIIAVMTLLYAGKRINWSVERKFLLLMCMTLLAAVFLKNVSGYFSHYLVIAIQPRYLFVVLPILIVLCAYAAGIILDNHRKLAALGLVIIILLLTQGGGMTSYLMRSEPAWFWDNTTVRSLNKSLKELAQPVIKEYPNKYGF